MYAHSGMCKENTHHLTLAFPSASHLRNDNHNQNIAAVSPLEKMIGLILFLRYLVSKIRKDLIQYLRPMQKLYFSKYRDIGNGREADSKCAIRLIVIP